MESRRSGVVVLWEDSFDASTPTAFGPHRLLVASVADVLSAAEPDPEGGWGPAMQSLDQLVTPHPCNGVDKLRAKLRTGELATRGEHMVAVVDGDEICPRLKLPHGAPHASIEKAIRSDAAVTVSIFILENNVEDLARRLAAHAGTTNGDLELIASKARGAPRARDAFFMRHSRRGQRTVRDRLQTSVDGWIGWPALVAHVAALMR